MLGGNTHCLIFSVSGLSIYLYLTYRYVDIANVMSAEDHEESDSDKAVDENLQRDDDGYAILPARGDRTLSQCKQTIREYVTVNYRMSSLQSHRE
jgi:hypothetical protein